jgi:hypothetical protein
MNPMADLSDNGQGIAPKNHNNPPSDLEMLGESLTLKYVHSMRAAEAHIAMVGQMPDHFTDENEASYTTDLIKLMQNCAKHLEGLRKEEKEPFLRQGQYVDSFFGDYINKLSAAIATAKRPLEDWLLRKAQAEQAQRDADAKLLHEQQAAALARVAAEATPENIKQVIDNAQSVRVAAALVAQPINTMASTAGRSSRAGLATKWVGTITDIESLDIVKLKPYIAVAELDKALARFVKQGGRQCEGAKIIETTESKVK